MALLPEYADAETRFIGQGITAIARSGREKIVNQSAVALHDGERNLLGLIRRQRFDRRIDVDGFELAEVFHLGRMSDGKVKIRNAVVGFQHRGKNFIKIGCSHGNYSSEASRGGSFRNGRNFFLSI